MSKGQGRKFYVWSGGHSLIWVGDSPQSAAERLLFLNHHRLRELGPTIVVSEQGFRDPSDLDSTTFDFVDLASHIVERMEGGPDGTER
jgi:hypothetical protein